MKRAFIFGDGKISFFINISLVRTQSTFTMYIVDKGLIGQRTDDWTPHSIRGDEHIFGGAHRAFCGPKYSIVFCGINYPMFLGNDQMHPMPLQQLDNFNVSCMDCFGDSIVFASTDKKLLTLRLNEMDNFSTVQDIDNLKITQISISNDDSFYLVDVDCISCRQKYDLHPKYMPLDHTLKFVLSYIEHMPNDRVPHFLRTEQTFKMLQL